MPGQQAIRIKTISEYHKYMQLSKPKHPLVSVTKFEDIKRPYTGPVTTIMDFYSIAINYCSSTVHLNFPVI